MGIALAIAVWTVTGAASFALPPPKAMLASNSTAELRARFDGETDPVRKAKLLVALSEAEFRDVLKDTESEDFGAALAIFQRYRDEAQACQKALEGKEPDPEKHPNGFKQLQISLRESLRRLSDIIVELPADEQKPFLDVRRDLEQMDRQLIHELFPRRPQGEPDPQPDTPKLQG
ncbi:MAG: hypothetical protein ABSB66_10695 [Candidatus Acidiferrales bacterium]|jgi:hypothetical protein